MDQAQGGEDQIIDQIGELFAQVSPEKQEAIISKLSEMLAGTEEAHAAPAMTISPEGGLNGRPV
ncbi:MAG TPA: hypothetical protein VK171_03580 [Fimbriimonas sp.]|nr:hypothetical protein [Fimbriimonas sp.]